MYKAFFTCNNGVYFECNNKGIFSDGIFDGYSCGFSSTSIEIINQCATKSGVFENLDALIFTHMHEDHFWNKEVLRISRLTGVPVYAPGFLRNTITPTVLSDKTSFFEIGGFNVFAVKTKHDGDARINQVEHESFVISTADESIFFAGDAVFSEEDYHEIKKRIYKPLTAAFVNPYHIIGKHNSDFLRALVPQKIYIIHRPLSGDDHYNVSILLDHALKHYPAGLPAPIVPQFNAWI